MCSRLPRHRPSCANILENFKVWFVEENEFITDEYIKKFLEKASANEFYRKLLISKDELNKLILLEETLAIKALFNDSINDGRYNEDFKESALLGSGSFGIVYKAKAKIDNIDYAIKKIPLMNYEKYAAREWKFMEECKNDYFVRYISAWTEHNYITLQNFDFNREIKSRISSDHVVFRTDNKLLLHIQMEFTVANFSLEHSGTEKGQRGTLCV
jgi:hypothetical protein